MRRPQLVFAILLLGIIAFSAWWIHTGGQCANARVGSMRGDEGSEAHKQIEDKARAPRGPESVTALQPNASGTIVLSDIAATAEQLNSPGSDVQADLDILGAMIDFYRRANNGDVPAGGLNEEIMDQMRGLNDRKLAVFPSTHPSVNSSGQLLDRWGVPYFFHPVSRTEIQIRSAGPDGVMWTEDDVQIGGGGEAESIANAASFP